MEILISIITGLLGGGGAGSVLKKLSMGKFRNMLTGGLGGLLGGLMNSGGFGDILGQLTGNPSGDAAVAGAAGGGILMTIIGLLKNKVFAKK